MTPKKRYPLIITTFSFGSGNGSPKLTFPFDAILEWIQITVSSATAASYGGSLAFFRGATSPHDLFGGDPLDGSERFIASFVYQWYWDSIVGYSMNSQSAHLPIGAEFEAQEVLGIDNGMVSGVIWAAHIGWRRR